MKVWKYSIKLWDFISYQGVPDKSVEGAWLTILINRASGATCLGALFICAISLFIDFGHIRMSISLMVSVLYSLIIFIHYFGKIHLARLYSTTIVPLWYAITLLLVGGNFSQSIAATSTLAIAYIAFEKKPKLRMWLILYNVMVYILPVTYLTFYPPFFGVNDYLFDEIVVFLLCVGWFSVVFSVYDKEKETLIEDLREKNKALERTTEELERFTYIASHDLKSPLRNIISFLGLAERKVKKKRYDGISEDLEFAKKGAEQMYYLVNDILELSRINVNSQEQRKWVDLNSVIEKTIYNIQQEIAEKKAIVNIPDLPAYLCNTVEFALVFQNIIQNGIKYNESVPPTVNIRTEQGNQQLIIHFEDNGIGIEEEYFERIFLFFKRLHTQEKYKGTGLGLGLCKKIIQNYNGEILVESKIGKGSIFTLQLPYNLRPSETTKKGTAL